MKKTKERWYTIGEIFRLGLLKNFDGEPYKHKATISRYVSTMKWRERVTRFGQAKEVSEKEIARFNKKTPK